MIMKKNSRLVYSTESGRIKEAEENPTPAKGDGIVRLYRETKGRKGKGVVIVDGLPLEAAELKAMAKKLKQLCGTGGAIKQGQIEIQGDKREIIADHLKQEGYTVKIAGG